MAWYWWVVAGIAAALLAKPLLHVARGTGVSVRAGGRLYLSSELKKWGIRGHIPDACVNEIADETTDFLCEYAKRKGESPMWAKAEMITPIERDARVILEWTRGRDIAGDSIKYIPAALKKYGVPLGSA